MEQRSETTHGLEQHLLDNTTPYGFDPYGSTNVLAVKYTIHQAQPVMTGYQAKQEDMVIGQLQNSRGSLAKAVDDTLVERAMTYFDKTFDPDAQVFTGANHRYTTDRLSYDMQRIIRDVEKTVDMYRSSSFDLPVHVINKA